MTDGNTSAPMIGEVLTNDQVARIYNDKGEHTPQHPSLL